MYQIINKIINKIHDYVNQTGRDPTHIIMNCNHYEQLYSICNKFPYGYYDFKKNNVGSPTKFHQFDILVSPVEDILVVGDPTFDFGFQLIKQERNQKNSILKQELLKQKIEEFKQTNRIQDDNEIWWIWNGERIYVEGSDEEFIRDGVDIDQNGYHCSSRLDAIYLLIKKGNLNE